MGIDLSDRNLDLHDNLGRRYYITGDKENAEPVRQLLVPQVSTDGGISGR